MVQIKNKKLQEQFEFTIVGGGELKGEYSQNHYLNKIQKLGLGDFVNVIPSASRDKMVKLLQETDVFISTSIAETFGVAICEAMLCGKPVISTKNGGVNDYANDQNSILIPLKDPEALMNAIIKVKQEYTFFDAQNIRNSILVKYGSKAFHQRMSDIYTKVLESN
jgi:glycosyltransferase involved in cell wall biosynthesis